jgi:hypothetical protein
VERFSTVVFKILFLLSHSNTSKLQPKLLLPEVLLQPFKVSQVPSIIHALWLLGLPIVLGKPRYIVRFARNNSPLIRQSILFFDSTLDI